MRANHWLDQQEARDPGFLRRIYFSNVSEGDRFTLAGDRQAADILAPIAKAAGVSHITAHVIQKERLRHGLSAASCRPTAQPAPAKAPARHRPVSEDAPVGGLPAIVVGIEPPPAQQPLPGVEPQSSIEKATWAVYRELKEHREEMQRLREAMLFLVRALREARGEVAA